MHGPVPQASPPQPQVSHSITSDGTPSVARSAAYFLQLHLEYGVESTHSCWICALPGSQGVHRSSKRCVPAARAGCGAATNSRHAFWDIFDAFGPYTRTTCREKQHPSSFRWLRPCCAPWRCCSRLPWRHSAAPPVMDPGGSHALHATPAQPGLRDRPPSVSLARLATPHTLESSEPCKARD